MGPQGPVKLLSTSVHHEIVEAILDSALSFLETTDVTKSLVEVAMAVIKTRNTSTGSIKRVKHHIYKDKPDRMPFWVGQFLAALRKDFPPIFIDDSVKGEAEVMSGLEFRVRDVAKVAAAAKARGYQVNGNVFAIGGVDFRLTA